MAINAQVFKIEKVFKNGPLAVARQGTLTPTELSAILGTAMLLKLGSHPAELIEGNHNFLGIHDQPLSGAVFFQRHNAILVGSNEIHPGPVEGLLGAELLIAYCLHLARIMRQVNSKSNVFFKSLLNSRKCLMYNHIYDFMGAEVKINEPSP
jgi:hypothetical protein